MHLHIYVRILKRHFLKSDEKKIHILENRLIIRLIATGILQVGSLTPAWPPVRFACTLQQYQENTRILLFERSLLITLHFWLVAEKD